MGKLYYLMGKSASGKDTIYDRLCKLEGLKLKPGIIYTTRPMRAGEVDGVNYHFSTQEDFERWSREGKVLESRTYQTVQGPWTYYTVDDGQFDDEDTDVLMVGTLESYVMLQKTFKERLVPLYVYVDDGERLMRAIQREKQQAQPAYEEMCRRFLADQKDFASEKLEAAGITEKYENSNLETCIQSLADRIGRRQ